ncbi:hypothetical protein [Roseisolibacter agri]|uniref:Uncharacterized protein n=1 Tax=Roseisolibacter agri TaxID=2014610 RepID=A0AA37Q4U9_9BACT|nr:hypothetical protein [Roseisolibacter agri]GLC23807.1 hypothetical protein rosag_03200 [Roseisolibacter agri]
MTAGNGRRLLVGAIKNGVLWGIAWGLLAFVTILVLRTIGVVVPATIGVLDALGMAIRVGIVGGIAGAAFAAFIRFFYRGRRLSDISPIRFGLGGAVVAFVFMFAFFALTNLASGDGFPPLANIMDDLLIAPIFGGIAAAASIWLAQRAEAAPDDDASGRLAGGASRASLGAGDRRDALDAIGARHPEPARRPSDE